MPRRRLGRLQPSTYAWTVDTIALTTGALLRYAHEQNLSPDAIHLELPAIDSNGEGMTRVEANSDKFKLGGLIDINPAVHPAGVVEYILQLALRDRTRSRSGNAPQGLGASLLGGVLGSAAGGSGPCTQFAFKHKGNTIRQIVPLSHKVVQQQHSGSYAGVRSIDRVPPSVAEAFRQSYGDHSSIAMADQLVNERDPVAIATILARMHPQGREGGERGRPDNRRGQWTAGYELMRFRNTEQAESTARQMYEEFMHDAIRPDQVWS